MGTFSEKLTAWWANDTARGIAPWIIGLAAFYLITSQVTYLRTKMDATVTGLETGTIYLRQKKSGFCVGDIMQFRSLARSSSYFRTVVADSGATFGLDDTGYQIDGAAVAMPVEWRAMAQVEMADREVLTVPEGHVLFINPDFDAEKRYNFWAFETVPQSKIRSRVSHILLSRDLSRIGEQVGSASPDCIR